MGEEQSMKQHFISYSWSNKLLKNHHRNSEKKPFTKIIAAYHRNKLKWGGWEPPLHDSENRFVEKEEDQCHVLKRVPSNTRIIFDSPFSCLNKYCWSPSRKTFVSDQDIQVITKQTLEMQEKWQSRKVIQNKIQTQQQLHSSPCDCVIGLPLGFTAFNFPLNVANQTQS